MMVRRGILCLAVLAVGLLFTGCTRGSGTGGPAAANVSAAAATGHSESGRLAGLKDCPAAGQGSANVDCVVRSADGAKRVLEVTGSGPYKVEVFDANGVAQQELPAPKDPEGRFGLPEFKDLDGDGSAEVLLPFGGGGTSGARSFEVWRAGGAAGRFADAGRIEGQGDFPRTSDGKFFGDYGRAGAGAAVFDFYRFAGDKAVEVLKLDVNVRHDDASGGVVGTTCGLSEDDYPEGSRAKRDAALKAAGAEPAEAARAYCGEPWVRSVFGS